jgi:hypothetical protein
MTVGLAVLALDTLHTRQFHADQVTEGPDVTHLRFRVVRSSRRNS